MYKNIFGNFEFKFSHSVESVIEPFTEYTKLISKRLKTKERTHRTTVTGYHIVLNSLHSSHSCWADESFSQYSTVCRRLRDCELITYRLFDVVLHCHQSSGSWVSLILRCCNRAPGIFQWNTMSYKLSSIIKWRIKIFVFKWIHDWSCS